MKRVYVVLDIETVTSKRLAFDVGWIIYSAKGKELERYNVLVSDITTKDDFIYTITHDRFMSSKAWYYIDKLFKHTIETKPLHEIAQDFSSISVRYNANVIVCAYNARFDVSVLNNNASSYYNSAFFDSNVEIIDIMTVALGTYCNTDKYARFCFNNNFLTDSGNLKTNAETVYRYISGNTSFSEEHHALADCEIESELLFRGKAYKKTMPHNYALPVNGCPQWHKVQSHIPR